MYICFMRKKTKKNPETSYFLICFGEFKSATKMIKKIADNLMPAVSSQNVKYYNNDLNIIYHFKSEQVFEDLKVFIDDSVTDLVGMYFLITCNDNVSLGMPNEIYEYLCELDNDDVPPAKYALDVKEEDHDEYSEIESLLEKMKNEDLFTDEPSEIDQIIKKSKKDEQPSLDTLLDKISTSGMGSLTKKEQELLQYYSNK